MLYLLTIQTLRFELFLFGVNQPDESLLFHSQMKLDGLVKETQEKLVKQKSADKTSRNTLQKLIDTQQEELQTAQDHIKKKDLVLRNILLIP